LNGLFQRDNAAVIQEYLAIFQQLICYHEPELANHLHDMDGQAFVPDLYAIPWFLTMFSHVFPIKKIFHLWDKLLVYDSSLPLFIAVAIMIRLKRQLMTFSFNDCILSFSDMPDIDVDDIVTQSTVLHRDTPPSCSYRVHQPDFADTSLLAIHKEDIDLQARRMERLPIISLSDVCRLNRIKSSTFIGNFTGEEFEIVDDIENLATIERLLIVDCRDEADFKTGTLPGAINLPSKTSFEDPTSEVPISTLRPSLSSIKLISARGSRIIVVAGKDTRDGQAFAERLLSLGYPKLTILHGGFNLLSSLGATLELPDLREDS